MRAARAELAELALQRVLRALRCLLQLRQNFVDHRFYPIEFGFAEGRRGNSAASDIARDRSSFHGFGLCSEGSPFSRCAQRSMALPAARWGRAGVLQGRACIGLTSPKGILRLLQFSIILA